MLGTVAASDLAETPSAHLCTLCCSLGLGWHEKKSICNKFPQSRAVTSLCWPSQRHNEVVFGLSDGKVKLGLLKANKTYSMYQHPDSSCVVSLAANSSGTAVISGHADGSVYRFTFPETEGQAPTYAKLLQHSCSPTALAWGDTICVTGSDSKVNTDASSIGPTLAGPVAGCCST